MESKVENWVRLFAYEDDELAFKKFFDHYFPRLFEIARHFTFNREISEEIVSEVFIKVWKNRNTFGSVSDHFSYLYTAVKRQSINKLRKKSYEPDNYEDIDKHIIAEAQNPQNALIEKQLLEKYASVIESLPEQQQLVFKLAKEDGLTYRAIAELMEISVKTVEMHMSKALKKIREDIRKYLHERENPPMWTSSWNQILMALLSL
ncbi:MAG: RNA polymerase sigma-70 factor [Cytophagales bacterium]|nr:RNA polymerase sigma-70 factor [Cytophagales bacterium]